jgi:UPF0176 protein
MSKYKVISFYKYVDIENPESLAEEHLNWCVANGVKGKVYLAKEGINGCVFGDDETTDKFKTYLKSYKIFEDVWFKETSTEVVAFNKMHVRVKSEIVNSGLTNKIRKHSTKTYS